MTLAPHGELLNLLRRLGSFDNDVCRFYAAELVLALEYMHYELGVIHRCTLSTHLSLINHFHLQRSKAREHTAE